MATKSLIAAKGVIGAMNGAFGAFASSGDPNNISAGVNWKSVALGAGLGATFGALSGKLPSYLQNNIILGGSSNILGQTIPRLYDDNAHFSFASLGISMAGGYLTEGYSRVISGALLETTEINMYPVQASYGNQVGLNAFNTIFSSTFEMPFSSILNYQAKQRGW